MAKKKPKQQLTINDQIKDIVELIDMLKIPDDALDGDLEDQSNLNAKLELENIKNCGWFEKLQYLYFGGYGLKRLKELLEDYHASERFQKINEYSGDV